MIVLGLYSPNSQMGGRVFDVRGIAPTVMAGTHGYGFGCILVYEESDTDKHGGRGMQVPDDEAGASGVGELPRADGARRVGLSDDEHNGGI